jgi:hypothetical protein
MLVLRAGTLDDSHKLEPRVHIWTSRKQPWIKIPEGTPSFREQVSDQAVWLRLVRPHT